MKDTQSLTQSSYQVTSCNPAVEHIGNEGGKFPLSFPNVSQYFQIFLGAFLKIFPKMFLRHLFPPFLSHFPILHMFPSSCLEATFRKPAQKQLCQVYFRVDQHSFCLMSNLCEFEKLLCLPSLLSLPFRPPTLLPSSSNSTSSPTSAPSPA